MDKKYEMDRRSLLKGSTAAAAVAAVSAEQLFNFATAWAQSAPFKPEANAKINVLRWRRFVEAEDKAFMAMVEAFQKATGVAVSISNESFDDIQPKASVAANTGQGLDMVWGLYSLPHLFPEKCLDVSDVANYLGNKYGGWVPSAEQYGKSGNKWINTQIIADVGTDVTSVTDAPGTGTFRYRVMAYNDVESAWSAWTQVTN